MKSLDRNYVTATRCFVQWKSARLICLVGVPSSNQENLRGCWVFLRFSFSVISNHRAFCWAEVGKTPENPRFSWLLVPSEEHPLLLPSPDVACPRPFGKFIHTWIYAISPQVQKDWPSVKQLAKIIVAYLGGVFAFGGLDVRIRATGHRLKEQRTRKTCSRRTHESYERVQSKCITEV